MISILTHRGIDPSGGANLLESSKEAFQNQLKRGFGLEFDVQNTRDGEIVVIHDDTLSRLTNGLETKHIKDCTLGEITQYQLRGGTIGTLTDILSLITRFGSPDVIHALHLKSPMQIPAVVDTVLKIIKHSGIKNIFLFDIKKETACLIKNLAPSIQIAPSVAHPYDIARFNKVVGGTLISPEAAVTNRNLYNWVWLDEWDRQNVHGTTKKFYTDKLFKRLREAGFFIGLVTPELHRHSPGLLGGETHEDALNNEILHKRIAEIVSLRPDAICTDYPDFVRSHILNLEVRS